MGAGGYRLSCGSNNLVLTSSLLRLIMQDSSNSTGNHPLTHTASFDFVGELMASCSLKAWARGSYGVTRRSRGGHAVPWDQNKRLHAVTAFK